MTFCTSHLVKAQPRAALGAAVLRDTGTPRHGHPPGRYTGYLEEGGNWLEATDGPRQGFATGKPSILFRHRGPSLVSGEQPTYTAGWGVFEGFL
ncbi:hypothetical protein N7534_008331 [Penicillium rubens]|nr:hypothetical protein N7524_003641 [Penicillium chrysogenum]KAJ5849013.1 hypothetical protein N7534_008331 [Penicillium rubens]